MNSEVYCFDCNQLIGYASNSGPVGIIICPDCREQLEEKELEESE